MESIVYIDKITQPEIPREDKTLTQEIRDKFVELNIPVNYEANSDIQRIDESKSRRSK